MAIEHINPHARTYPRIAEASDMTALEAVVSVDEERAKLEKEADILNNLMTEDVRAASVCSSNCIGVDRMMWLDRHHSAALADR